MLCSNFPSIKHSVFQGALKTQEVNNSKAPGSSWNWPDPLGPLLLQAYIRTAKRNSSTNWASQKRQRPAELPRRDALQPVELPAGSAGCSRFLVLWAATWALVMQMSLSYFYSCKWPLIHTPVSSPRKTHWFSMLDYVIDNLSLMCVFPIWGEYNSHSKDCCMVLTSGRWGKEVWRKISEGNHKLMCFVFQFSFAPT